MNRLAGSVAAVITLGIATLPVSAQATPRTREVCTGSFAQMSVEHDRVKPYLHFGGIQQCSPEPASQKLEIHLYRLDGRTKHLVGIAKKYQVGWMVPAYGEPYCASTRTATYQMNAQGTADGIPSNPWPAAWSKPQRLPCYLR
jgi:hypothetical protein